MTRKFNFLCTLSLLVLFSTLAVAQPNATPASEDGVIQQTEETAKYPEAPNDMWELGVNVGLGLMNGDVFSNIPGGFGAGFHVRKSLGYTLSVRGGYTFHRMSGINFYPTAVDAFRNRAATDLGYDLFVDNFQSTVHSINVEAIFNLNNLKFHKSTSKWGFYAGLGAGYDFYSVMYDATDANGAIYDFSGVATTIANRGDVSRDDASTIDGIVDGTYETAQSTEKLFEFENSPFVSIVTGVSYKISEKMNISLDNKYNASFQDNLDGTRANGNNDGYFYSSLRLNFNLGDPKKQSEPLYWLNPLDAPYDMIANNTQRLDNLGNLLADQDGDGVPDKLDKEQNTPAGAIVNTKGETMDSDGDGVADYLDKEPHSAPGASVDKDGVDTAVEPDYVTQAELKKMETDNKWVNEVVEVKPVETASNWFLPMIHFDNGSSKIKPTYYAQLHHVATVMQKNSDITVVVEGHASSTASVNVNQELSQKRAEAAAKFLSENYGIPSSRLVVTYKGETEPLKGSAGSNYMNRRVEFRVQ